MTLREQIQIEGRRPVLEALRAGLELSEILIADSAHGAVVRQIRSQAQVNGVPATVVAAVGLRERSESRNHQGIIALGSFGYSSIESILSRAAKPFLIALDGITDPHNVGALARSAEAAGAHGMVLPARRSAPVNAGVVKASAGALAWLPVAQVPNLTQTLKRLKSAGLWIIALDGETSETIYDLDLADEPLCLVVGAESDGVSRLVLETCDVRVSIPMAGNVESLNASVAGAIAMFEIARLRES